MDTTRTQHRPSRPLRSAALSLFVTAFAFAFVAGCGGAKTETTGDAAGTPTPSTPPPAEVAAVTPGSPEDIKAQFATKCASCHGAQGMGDGIAAKALNPQPRNFHDQAYMSSRTDEQLTQVIREGKGAMPKWAGILSDEQIVGMVAHIRELGRTP